jgi:hypothetical protein
MNLKNEIQTLPPPPGIIGSLRIGFDTIAAHITAIFLPLALDLFLWFGPHFSMSKELFQPLLSQIRDALTQSGLSASDATSAMSGMTQLFQNFNWLSELRTFPIGVPSLLVAKVMANQDISLLSPLGAPQVIQINSFGQLFNILILATICGWILGSLYFRWIAVLVAPDTSGSTVHAVLQTILYSVCFLIVGWILWIPIGLLLLVLSAINVYVVQCVMLILLFFATWLIVPIFFSSFGIYLRKQNVLTSFLSGIQLTRFALPTSSLFVLTMLMIGIGLNFLWSIPLNDSWLALVGILGHAFITTALLASSFVYYRDTTSWLQSVFEKLRAANIPTQQA